MEDCTIIICGTGFSGIGMAAQLLKRGFKKIVVLERAASVGGTWRDNSYPGAACDVMSHLYSFSFYQNPNWSATFSGWEEIGQYLEDCADHFNVRPLIEFEKEVLRAEYISDANKSLATGHSTQTRWLVYVKGEAKPRCCQFFISAAGVFSRIAIPQFPGMQTFRGEQFHTGRWDHSVTLDGKRVAVVGTGASAIQVIPEIAKVCKHVTVFQRSAAWVLPKVDYRYSATLKKLFHWFPPLLWLSRLIIYLRAELLITVVFLNAPSLIRYVERRVAAYVDKVTSDPEKRKLLVPNYLMGCKRILMSNTYMRTMASDKVTIVPQTIASVTPTGIKTIDGTEHEVDAIVYATGFQVTDCTNMHGVINAKGEDLRALWADTGMQAYLGTFIHGFPNFFILLGPNSGLGTNSVVFMIECQINMIIRLIEAVLASGGTTMEVQRDVQNEFNDKVQKDLKSSLWLSGCRSWYLDAHGRNSTMWPYATLRFWWQTATVSIAKFTVTA